MVSISVAEIAAIINVAIIIVKFSYPLLITLLAVGTLRRSTNAATWSVFGRLINQSLWRVLLRTDTASSTKVDKLTRGLSAFSTLLGLLLAVAAAITPLGLHETFRLRDSENTPFTYVKDLSAVGQSTPSHNTYAPNRLCGYFINEPCPGTPDGKKYTHNTTGIYTSTNPGEEQSSSISTKISQNITDVFTSVTNGTKGTVASVFDIQYRFFINYNNATNPGENSSWLDQGQPRTQGRFRFSQDFIAEPQVRAVEGLLVSTKDEPGPGIGFRNHTLPMDSDRHGYTWEEDILWLEPETVCTDLNLTYEFTMPSSTEFYVPNARIVDRGGFANVFKGYPYIDLNDTQTDPLLLLKAWKGAVLTNKVLEAFLNETRNNTRVGKEYLLKDYNVEIAVDNINPRELSFSGYGSLDDQPLVAKPSLPPPLDLIETDYKTYTLNSTYDPFNIDTVIRWGGADIVNISYSGVSAGLMLGIGKSLDAQGNAIPQEEERYDPGTNWSQPLFSCASTVKASIKTVRFEINGTSDLSNLKIISVRKSDAKPTWGMENPGLQMSQISPFWGLVSPEAADNPSISTVTKDEFYLPAGASSVLAFTVDGTDAVAGAQAPFSIFSTIYKSYQEHTIPDLSGNGNWPLAQKWASFGANASTAGGIPNYIWTDLMANALVGSKSILTQPDGSDSTKPVMMRTAYYEKSVGYDWKYAIPALIFAALYVSMLACSLLVLCVKRGVGMHTLKFMLNQSSAGRSMTTERFQASDQVDLGNTKEWARVRGDELVRVGAEAGGDAKGDHTLLH